MTFRALTHLLSCKLMIIRVAATVHTVSVRKRALSHCDWGVTSNPYFIPLIMGPCATFVFLCAEARDLAASSLSLSFDPRPRALALHVHVRRVQLHGQRAFRFSRLRCKSCSSRCTVCSSRCISTTDGVIAAGARCDPSTSGEVGSVLLDEALPGVTG